MTSKRLTIIRNKPIKINREKVNDVILLQGPTIGELYDDEHLFMASQLITMEKKELMEFLQIKNEETLVFEMYQYVLQYSEHKEDLLLGFQKIIPGMEIDDGFIIYNNEEITENEWELIKSSLQVIMGQKSYDDFIKDGSKEELSPEELRMIELEAKVQRKKQKENKKEENTENNESGGKHILEDIIVSLIYEFGFTLEYIMNMNYFTVLWYYSYTSKIHIYKINHAAIANGYIKTINTDYFTNLK